MLDPLMHAIMANLDHTHPYVKRNAVMCVYSIFMAYGEELVPDIAVKIEELLRKEGDLSTRRNALLLLFEADPDAALRYINEVMIGDEESAMYNANADILQLVLLDELKKTCKQNPIEKGRYMKVIYTLSQTSKSQSVLFECASTIF
jgi:coatomer subunit beta